ncbi:hypothetical protein EYB26_003396 [Talaromyces marneffei]|uniref:uncharacterized protein n=1 Tax=Talaromyces marneffei TaxID=37727 RepID=UPI0012A9A82D|nr:uncharacterized protein EYB26_003396 [Talaromyces marneffei]QGA15736.1 hypothetical protein EYB26_003396 [Talaromyces marneffei]
MDLQRSILNKTNAISKYLPSPVHHNHFASLTTSRLSRTFTPSSTLSPSTSSAPLMSSHFTTEHSKLREEEEGLRIAVEEKPVPAREFGSRAPDEYNHSHHKLMAMADLVTDPAYTQQSTWTYQYNDSAGRPYWQHPLLSPVTSTSPQEYTRHNGCFQSVSATDATAQANNNGSVCDEDGTDIDNNSPANEHDAASYATPPTVGGSMKHVAAQNGTTVASEDKKESESPKVIHLCQYTDMENNVWGPCNENPNPEDINARKIVSHIFGRNKKPTQNIPDELWIWYCRKHYQRSKYTCSNQWPQKQVDLVRLALDNFEKWGEILYWNVVLRKREQDRQERTRRSASSMDSPTSEYFYFATSPRRRTATTRNPSGKVPRTQKARVTAAAAAAAGHLSEAISFESMTSRNAHPGLTPTGRRKASPKNVPCPVPDFVYPYLGERRSFTTVRHLIDHIENYIQGKDKTAEQLAREAEDEEVLGRAPEVRRFPDIEILPVFTTRYQRLMDKKDEDDKREKKSNIRAGDVGLSQSSSKTAKIYKNAANSDVYRDVGRDYHYQASPPSNHHQQHQSQHHSYFHLPHPPQLAPANPGFHLPPPVPHNTTHTTLPYPTPYREYTSYTPSQQHDSRPANAQHHSPFQHQQYEGRTAGLPLPSISSQFSLPDF